MIRAAKSKVFALGEAVGCGAFRGGTFVKGALSGAVADSV
jgi:hypothetical protein